MPETRRIIDLEADMEKVWSTICNPSILGGCIPGCERVEEINEFESKWFTKMRVGVISKHTDFSVHLEKLKPHLIFTFNSQDGMIRGRGEVSIAPSDEHRTKLDFRVDISAGGQFKWIVEQMINNQMDRFSNEFSKCMMEKLQSSK
ncbi:MAG: SRPBCC domain-containing protein [Thaumarchaeota archaeon]|nr:SRPBCC domain-containing protein [Nitrososphaerota archaeon]